MSELCYKCGSNHENKCSLTKRKLLIKECEIFEKVSLQFDIFIDSYDTRRLVEKITSDCMIIDPYMLNTERWTFWFHRMLERLLVQYIDSMSENDLQNNTNTDGYYIGIWLGKYAKHDINWGLVIGGVSIEDLMMLQSKQENTHIDEKHQALTILNHPKVQLARELVIKIMDLFLSKYKKFL